MTDKVIIHGVEYVPKVVPEPTKVEPAKGSRWRPVDGEQYFWVDWDGVSRLSVNENLLFDEGMLKMGNVYQTKELATKARDRRLLLVELQDYADQKNEGKEMTAIHYFLDRSTDKWNWGGMTSIVLGTVIFWDKVDAASAIDYFGDRLDLLL